VSVRTILRLGTPSLREPAVNVAPDALGSTELRQLVQDLFDTMDAASGAGLAAPQVGDARRVCVVEIRNNPRYPYLPAVPRTVLINPVVTQAGEGSVEMYEGCLSVPRLRGKVRRPRQIEVRALDEEGRPRRFIAEGAAAAVLQHEVDHLDGILFVDRCDPRTLAFLDEFEEHIPAFARFVDSAGHDAVSRLVAVS